MLITGEENSINSNYSHSLPLQAWMSYPEWLPTRSCFYLMITPCYYDHRDFDYSISEHSRVLTGHFFFFFLFLGNVLTEKNASSVLSELKNNKYLWSQVQQISLRMGGGILYFVILINTIKLFYPEG